MFMRNRKCNIYLWEISQASFHWECYASVLMTCRARIFLGFTAVPGLAAGSSPGADAKLGVLILSGANHHDWKTTTPATKADAGRMAQ